MNGASGYWRLEIESQSAKRERVNGASGYWRLKVKARKEKGQTVQSV